MIVIEAMLRVASGYGTIAAIVTALVFAFLGYAGGSLTHGVTHSEAIWFAVKGAVFGAWFAFTPFAVWSLVRMFTSA
jgi:hypothetical protein